MNVRLALIAGMLASLAVALSLLWPPGDRAASAATVVGLSVEPASQPVSRGGSVRSPTGELEGDRAEDAVAESPVVVESIEERRAAPRERGRKRRGRYESRSRGPRLVVRGRFSIPEHDVPLEERMLVQIEALCAGGSYPRSGWIEPVDGAEFELSAPLPVDALPESVELRCYPTGWSGRAEGLPLREADSQDWTCDMGELRFDPIPPLFRGLVVDQAGQAPVGDVHLTVFRGEAAAGLWRNHPDFLRFEEKGELRFAVWQEPNVPRRVADARLASNRDDYSILAVDAGRKLQGESVLRNRSAPDERFTVTIVLAPQVETEIVIDGIAPDLRQLRHSAGEFLRLLIDPRLDSATSGPTRYVAIDQDGRARIDCRAGVEYRVRLELGVPLYFHEKDLGSFQGGDLRAHFDGTLGLVRGARSAEGEGPWIRGEGPLAWTQKLTNADFVDVLVPRDGAEIQILESTTHQTDEGEQILAVRGMKIVPR